MSIILYQLNVSPPCRAVQMLAELLGLDIQKKIVNVSTGEQMTPEFLKKNPLHTIPLLEDSDFILPDSHAILMYLVSKYGGEKRDKLYPNDLRIRSTINQRLFFDASVLHAKMLSIGKQVRENKTGLTSEHREELNECYGFLEKYLQSSSFVASDDITIADISCVATISSLNCVAPIEERYTKVRAWLNRLEREDWYQKENVPGLNDFAGAMKSLGIE